MGEPPTAIVGAGLTFAAGYAGRATATAMVARLPSTARRRTWLVTKTLTQTLRRLDAQTV